MTRVPIAALAAACAVSAAPAAFAADWPQFRGPTGQGLATAAGLPLRWSPRQNVAWKQTVPGKGWSSPVLAGTRIFLTTAVDVNPGASRTDRSLRALCFDAATGAPVWNVEVFRQRAAGAYSIHGKNSHASPTPHYENGALYVHFGHDGTACLDARTGKIKWKQTALRYPPVHGNGGSPVIAGGNLIFNCDGVSRPYVAALDKRSGRVKWTTERRVDVQRPFSFSTPLLIRVNGREQLVSPGSGAVIAYQPSSGKEIWRCRYGEGYSVVPRPVSAHGLVFACSGFNTAHLYAIRPDGRGDVTDTHVAWRHTKAVPKSASPIVAGENLYMVDDKGIATCLDARTGSVRWQERLGGNYSASPIHAQGLLFFLSEEGKTTIVRAGSRFETVAVNDLDERSFASFLPANGALYIRTEHHLYRIRGNSH